MSNSLLGRYNFAGTSNFNWSQTSVLYFCPPQSQAVSNPQKGFKKVEKSGLQIVKCSQISSPIAISFEMFLANLI